MNTRPILVTVLLQTLVACASPTGSSSGSKETEVTTPCTVGAAQHAFAEDVDQASITATLHNEFTDDFADITWVDGHVARVICDQPETVTFHVKL